MPSDLVLVFISLKCEIEITESDDDLEDSCDFGEYAVVREVDKGYLLQLSQEVVVEIQEFIEILDFCLLFYEFVPLNVDFNQHLSKNR